MYPGPPPRVAGGYVHSSKRNKNGYKQKRPTPSSSRRHRLQQTQANPGTPNQIPHRRSTIRWTGQNHPLRTARRPHQPNRRTTRSIQIPTPTKHRSRPHVSRILGRQSQMVPQQNRTTQKQEMGQRLLMGYTKPDLRKRIVSSVKAGTQGGKAGQWSARKAQIVAQRYEKAGGGYTGSKTKAQSNLTKWTKEKWRTSDRKPAERPGGTTRYLPDAAWKKLTPAQRAATNRKKIAGSKQGKQFVPNTPAAKKAGKTARNTKNR